MRAVVQEVYGEPEEVLTIREVDKPSVPDDGVLVRVHAASIHIGDCHVVRGVPKAMRPIFGLRGPKAAIPGVDLAGTVEAVGSNVTSVKVGDAVFGNGAGAFAEYAVAKGDMLAPKPGSLSFEEASALGVSAQTALQALRDQLKVEPGMKVLIVGASGGVGSFAVQIAKSMGAEVTGVCSTPNVEMVRALGADHVIDYKMKDYINAAERYDLILDNVAAHAMGEMRKLLAPGGRLLSNGAPVGGWFGGLGNVFKAFAFSLVNRQQARPFVSISTGADARALAVMVDEGKLKPAIGSTFSFEESPQAVANVATGHGQGKTVITMAVAEG